MAGLVGAVTAVAAVTQSRDQAQPLRRSGRLAARGVESQHMEVSASSDEGMDECPHCGRSFALGPRRKLEYASEHPGR